MTSCQRKNPRLNYQLKQLDKDKKERSQNEARKKARLSEKKANLRRLIEKELSGNESD